MTVLIENKTIPKTYISIVATGPIIAAIFSIIVLMVGATINGALLTVALNFADVYQDRIVLSAHGRQAPSIWYAIVPSYTAAVMALVVQRTTRSTPEGRSCTDEPLTITPPNSGAKAK